VLRLAVADHDVGLAGHDRGDQVGDAVLRVLVVAVGVDDDVGPVKEGVVHPVAEGPGETHVAHVVHEVLDAVLARHLDGAVGRAVVDDQDVDLINARDGPRDRRQDGGEGLLFVETRNLHEQLHDTPELDWGRPSTCPPLTMNDHSSSA